MTDLGAERVANQAARREPEPIDRANRVGYQVVEAVRLGRLRARRATPVVVANRLVAIGDQCTDLRLPNRASGPSTRDQQDGVAFPTYVIVELDIVDCYACHLSSSHSFASVSGR
ncbi:hypothetical protein GCM10027569_31030 [Flindersiella endophytica]